MKKRNIGIYLGENFVCGALCEGTKLISHAKCHLATLGEQSETEILNEEVLWEAAINKTLREIKATKKEVFVSLADKDFIFRCFEMPLMGKKEIETSLGFELEKFIPFKIEDLIWDYRYTRVPKEKKINLSFLGMKNNIYKQHKELFARLDIKVLNVEPSAISLVRAIKTLGMAKKITNFAVLDFSETETYITFFQDDLPIFNRYLSVSQRAGMLAMDKLIEEVRISIQYFRREFRGNVLDKLFIMGAPQLTSQFRGLAGEIDIDISVINPGQLLGEEGMAAGDVKAYAVSISSAASYKFTPILKEAEESLMARERMLWDVPFNIPLLLTVGIISLIGCIFLHIMLGNKIAIEKVTLKKRGEQAMLPDVLKDKKLSDIESYYKDKEKKAKNIQSEIDVIAAVTPLLRQLPTLLNEGIWLQDFSFQNKNDELLLNISGFVFLGDTQKEKESFDTFIAKIKEDEEINKLFTKVELQGTERIVHEGYDVMLFRIRLED